MLERNLFCCAPRLDRELAAIVLAGLAPRQRLAPERHAAV